MVCGEGQDEVLQRRGGRADRPEQKKAAKAVANDAKKQSCFQSQQEKHLQCLGTDLCTTADLLRNPSEFCRRKSGWAGTAGEGELHAPVLLRPACCALHCTALHCTQAAAWMCCIHTGKAPGPQLRARLASSPAPGHRQRSASLSLRTHNTSTCCLLWTVLPWPWPLRQKCCSTAERTHRYPGGRQVPRLSAPSGRISLSRLAKDKARSPRGALVSAPAWLQPQL